MAVEIVLREYLKKLRKCERLREPHERRIVPSLTELAKIAGVSKTGLMDMVHGRTNSIRKDVIGKVISQLRACGFDTDIGDVIRYEPR